MASEAPPQSGAAIVREVFDRVRSGVNPVELFADDAIIVPGGRDPVRGRAQIEEFYRQTIAGIHPRPRVHSVFESAPQFVAVVDVPNTAVRQRAIDLFTVDGGKIRKLEIMSRPAIDGVDAFLD